MPASIPLPPAVRCCTPVARATLPAIAAARRGRGLKELSILLVTIAAASTSAVTNAAFNTADNYQTIAQYVAPWSIIAAGEVMLLICGEIDLSAGFVFALAPFMMMPFVVNGAPLLLALLVGAVVAPLIGVVNGLIRTVLQPPVLHHHAGHGVPAAGAGR